MPDKVANNSPDNRTLNATARSRISLTCKGNGSKDGIVTLSVGLPLRHFSRNHR